jgi:hypothetical protein
MFVTFSRPSETKEKEKMIVIDDNCVFLKTVKKRRKKLQNLLPNQYQLCYFNIKP